MNTGIQDAFNLGWKLAAVAQNRARRELLDTYQAERAPVVNRLVKGTRTFTRLVLLGNPLATAARRGIASRVMSHPGPKQTLAQALSEIDVSYRTQSRRNKRRPLAVGDRAPNAQMEGRSRGIVTSLFDVFDRKRHTLLAMAPVPQNLTDMTARYADDVKFVCVVPDAQLPCADGDSVYVDVQRQVERRYGMPAGRYALIRPDGYVGALGNARDALDPSHRCRYGRGAMM
jgi:hypothetical protein